MKIVDIVPRVVWKEMSGTLRNPRLRWTRKQVMLVFVVAEDGIVGVGETWSDGGSAEPLVSFLEQDLKPRLVGRDVDLVERFWAEALDIALISTRRSLTWQLMSAIDVALWDIRGKRARMPVWRLLGGDGRPVLPYASGGLYRDGQDEEAFGIEYGGFVRQGFRAVKIKVGGAPVAVDAARVASLRRHAGPLHHVEARPTGQTGRVGVGGLPNLRHRGRTNTRGQQPLLAQRLRQRDGRFVIPHEIGNDLRV